MQWAVENPDKGLPTLTDDGSHYFVSGEEYLGVSAGTTLGGVKGTGTDDFCVWVVSPRGTLFEARSDGSASEGSCG